MQPDFQIIGAGLIGLSTAHALQEKGASVRLIERAHGPAQGTSHANAGMVHTALADPWNGPGIGRQLLGSLINPQSPMKLRLTALPGLSDWGLSFLRFSRVNRHWQSTMDNYHLAAFSAQLVKDWQQKLAMKNDYQGDGLLKIFRNKAELDKASDMARRLQGLGLKAAFITASEAIAKEPCLAPIRPHIKGGIYYADDFAADAYGFCLALANHFKDRGGMFMPDTEVKNLIADKGQVCGVRTSSGDLLAKTTIIAAGAYSRGLLKPQGINLKMRPVKGYSLTFEGITGPRLPVADESLHAAVTPLGNRLRIAGTAEITGFDPSRRTARLQPLLGLLRAIYPELAKGKTLQEAKTWHGFRPVSADGVPYIGKTPLGGLAVNTGHGHMGWTFSAGSGELLAALLCGEDPAINPAPYAVMR